jgi:polysaccharide pyruvyl transferase CsaB
MRRTRLYINGGGSLMQDVTSRRSLWFYLFTISAAKLLGNKVLMYGCGIGPILYRSNRSLASRVLQRSVDAITLRDPHSGTELKNMGITRPEIILAADPTVILPSAPREAVDGLMETQGLSPDGNYIAFILRPWPGFDAVVPVFAAAAEYAYQKYGLLPVFLPIEPRLDLGAAHQVASCLQVPFHILQDTGTSAQTIGLLSRMRIVTSMRLHGLVFSAGQGVPLIGIVYDQKVSSFLTYIGQDLFTDLNALTAERLNAHIDAAHARIGDNAFLAEGVERLREIEGHNSETAAKLLNQS